MRIEIFRVLPLVIFSLFLRFYWMREAALKEIDTSRNNSLQASGNSFDQLHMRTIKLLEKPYTDQESHLVYASAAEYFQPHQPTTRQFYLSIPDELIDAARVDGVGYIGSYLTTALQNLMKFISCSVKILRAILRETVNFLSMTISNLCSNKICLYPATIQTST